MNAFSISYGEIISNEKTPINTDPSINAKPKLTRCRIKKMIVANDSITPIKLNHAPVLSILIITSMKCMA